MGKKVGAKNFFFVILSVGTLILSVYILQNRRILIEQSSAKRVETESITLPTGWSVVSTTLVTDLDAKALCGQIPSKGEICRYPGQYVCRACFNVMSTENFPIAANEGYFIFSDSPDSYNLTFTGVRSRNVPLLEGSSMVGFPNVHERKIMASDLCGRYPGTNLSIMKINNYQTDGTWLEYICGSSLSHNFQIVKNKAYFVLSEIVSKPGSSRNLKFKPSTPQRHR